MIPSQTRGGIIVNSDKPPIRISLDIFGIKLDLVLQAVLLLLMARADPTVSHHPKLLDLNRCQSFTLWYLNDISRHDKTSTFSAHVFMSKYNMEVSTKREATFQPHVQG